MQEIPPHKWKEWKRKRRNSLIGYILVGTVVGIDYSVVLATLYLYLKDEIKSNHPELFYGIITAMFSLSSVVSGLIAGRWVDHTRKIKIYLNIIFSIQIIGSLLYTIPYSVAYPLIGRIFVGIGDPFVNVCSGELIRIYDNEGGNRALWWLALVYSFGFIVGPGLSLMFKGIHFRIGAMRVTYLNFVGIFMAVLLIGSLVITNVLIHDCSAEIDLKEYLKHHKYTPGDTETGNKNNASETTPIITRNNDAIIVDTAAMKIPWQLAVKRLVTNIDTILIFISTFFFMYCLFSSDVLLPLISVVILQWDVSYLTYVFVGYGVGYFIVIMIMSKFCRTATGVYYGTLLCTACQVFQYSILLAISVLKRESNRDSALLAFFLFGWLFAWCIEEVLLRSIIAKMVPSQIQSFTETFRAGVARIATVVAGLTAPLLMPYLHWWSLTLICLSVVIMGCFLARIKYLTAPEEIDFFHEEHSSSCVYESCVRTSLNTEHRRRSPK